VYKLARFDTGLDCKIPEILPTRRADLTTAVHPAALQCLDRSLLTPPEGRSR
jgi:hypothetical protein